MSSQNDRDLKINRARRHFLGLAAATGAKVAVVGSVAATTLLPASAARALGTKWWKPGGTNGSPTCFLRGTSIMTSKGEVRVEDLRIGDLVETVRGKAMPVKWVGRHVYKRNSPSWAAGIMPIRISRHALDAATPHTDLYVSPGHALFIDGALIRAGNLVNGTSIVPALPDDRETIEYLHVLLDTHEVILAEGAAAETFLLQAGNHESFTNFAEFARLYPEGLTTAMTPFAPIVGYGGRKHLKALLRLAASCVMPVREAAGDVYDKIAARARQTVG